VSYEFEWDDAKAESNLKKHGVSFDEAVTVFADPLSLNMPDPAHSADEEPLSRSRDVDEAPASRCRLRGATAANTHDHCTRSHSARTP
jgi:uncharacterized DUF497 family protein